MYKANNQFCNIRLERKQEYVFNGLQEAQEVIEFDHDTYSDITGAEEMYVLISFLFLALLRPKIAPRNTQSALVHSQVESSFYSNYSSNTEAPKETAAVSILHKEAEMFAAELTSADSMGNSLSDEAFITKQVLAEQIGRYSMTFLLSYDYDGKNLACSLPLIQFCINSALFHPDISALLPTFFQQDMEKKHKVRHQLFLHFQ